MTDQTVNITTRQVAELASVEESTVRRWAEDGKIPGAWKTPGGHWRFDRGVVMARFSTAVGARS